MKDAIRISLLVVFLYLPTGAAGQLTYWLNTDEGNWHAPNNWTDGVPIAGWTAHVNNDGQAHIDQNGGACRYLYLGYGAGQTGRLRISHETAQLTLYLPHVGYSGVGEVLHQEGTVTATLEARFAYSPGSYGAYTLENGTFDVLGAEYLGYDGHAAFTQYGGTHNVATWLFLAYDDESEATYDLYDGDLNAADIRVGDEGIATFSQYGGAVVATNGLYVGMDVGTAESHYILVDGELTAAVESVGETAPGRFTQMGGTNTITGSLTLGGSNGYHYPECRGTYLLHAGTLQVNGGFLLADEARNNLFEQYGGTLTVGATFYVGFYGPTYSNAKGRYRAYAGRLEATRLHIGRGGCYGYFDLRTPSPEIHISEWLLLDQFAVVRAVPGCRIQMGAAAFNVDDRVTESYVDGLRNIEFVFDGGSGAVATVEVAGIDYGPTMSGYAENDGNFKLGALTLGGDDVGQVQLVDNQVHQYGSDEAVYVNRLTVGAGCLLDLNGYNLYYVEGTIDPSATILNGTPTPVLAGDHDGDQDIDADDWVAFSGCLAGPGDGVEVDCAPFDFDTESDIDLIDVAQMQQAFTGPLP